MPTQGYRWVWDETAGAAMAFSFVSVVMNSLRIKLRFKILD